MRYTIASFVQRVIVLLTVLSVLGCQDLTAKLPAGAVRSDFFQNEEAAYRLAKGARFEFQRTLLEFMRESGGFSDELRFAQYGRELGVSTNQDVMLEIDSRYVPETRVGFSGGVPKWPEEFGGYRSLQGLRSQALQARMALQKYAKDAPPYAVGEMVLYEGLAVVMLADLFCSGVPLSTVDFEQDFTYRPGSSTPDLYRHAIALFDTAIALTVANDSLYFAAKAGKARAHLALAEYNEADAAISGMSAGVEFKLPIAQRISTNGQDWSADPSYWNRAFRHYFSSSTTGGGDGFRFVADHEGTNGLPYLSEKDPRVQIDSSDDPVNNPRTNIYGYPNRFPKARTHLTIGSLLEVQLIKSEVLLNRKNPEWLIVLNTLRTDGTYSVSGGGDTVWHAGTGGIAGLRPLLDPGSDTARISLLFKERAYWLFFTGRRQGDMRRLVRNYKRPLESVYPMGSYEGGNGEFWPYMNLPIPDSERINPLFRGCLGRDV